MCNMYCITDSHLGSLSHRRLQAIHVAFALLLRLSGDSNATDTSFATYMGDERSWTLSATLVLRWSFGGELNGKAVLYIAGEGG